MINKTALKKACYLGVATANSCIGAVYLFGQLSIDFNTIVGGIYFIFSLLCIYLMIYEN